MKVKRTRRTVISVNENDLLKTVRSLDNIIIQEIRRKTKSKNKDSKERKFSEEEMLNDISDFNKEKKSLNKKINKLKNEVTIQSKKAELKDLKSKLKSEKRKKEKFTSRRSNPKLDNLVKKAKIVVGSTAAASIGLPPHLGDGIRNQDGY